MLNEDIRQQLLAVWAELRPDDRRVLVALAGEVRVNEATKDEIRQLGYGDDDDCGVRGGDWEIKLNGVDDEHGDYQR